MSILPNDTFATLGADPIGEAWRMAWTTPDRRSIPDWASTNVNLQGQYVNKGLFSIADSRHLELPFHYSLHDEVRQLNILKAVQTFGTGIADVHFQYVFAEAPGPCMWTLQTDDDAEQHYLTRVHPTLAASPIDRVRSLLQRLHKKRDLYQFPHLNIYFQGANLNSLQRKSIQYQYNDEVWNWSAGMLAEAFARTEAFAALCKIFNISQGGTIDTDWHHTYEAGRRHDKACHCLACGHLQPLEFFARMLDNPDKRAGLIWSDDARRPDGTWNHGRAVATTRFRCIKCGHDHPDTPRTWAAFNSQPDYIDRDPDRPLKNLSFRWTSLVRGRYGDLVDEFLSATELQKQGSPAALERFYQKKLALFWDPTMAVQKITLTTTDYAQEDWRAAGYKPTKTTEEKHRFITCDYQQGTGNEGRHFWVTARAWSAKGKGSRLLWFGRLRTFEQIADLQKALGVAPAAVCVDGSFEMMEVASHCATHGWTMLCGDDVEDYSHGAPKNIRNAKPRRRPFSPKRWIDPHKGKTAAGRTGCWAFYWSNPSVKNILWNLRHGHAAPWELPIDLPPEYRDQIDSEHKKRFINKKHGAIQYLWVKYKTDNHAWDCECMQVVCALIAGLIDYDFTANDDALRAKNSFESTAPDIAEPTATTPAARPASAAHSAPVAPYAQPQQLNLI